MFLTKRRLMRQIDQGRVQEAIEDAEQSTSGEIRVSVAPFFWGSVQKAAESAFVRLGMTRTAERNGVLFFVVPSRRRFVVLGDQGIHERVGQEFWDHIAHAMSEEFRSGHFTEGLIAGIEEVGARLGSHFPFKAGQDRDELSNAIDFGPPPEEP